MDELNQVLERMRTAFEDKKQNTSLTSQPSSISEGGNLTIAQATPLTSNQQSQNGSQRETGSQQNTLLRAEEKAELAKTLSRICAMQQKYGQTPAEVETLVDGFIWVIESTRYPLNLWLAAMAKHILQSTEIPRPADILAIIDPPKEPLSTAMYIKIMKDCTTGGKFLYGDKKDFVDAYETQEMAKMRGGSEEFREAKREIESYRMTQLEYANL